MNYSSEGMYFVTVCVEDRKCILGEVVSVNVRLSALGEIVRECWEEIPEHFRNASLDRYVIMPNHVHGIIFLDHKQVGHTGGGDVRCDTKLVRVEYIQPQRERARYQHVVHGSIGSIVRCFKAAVSRHWRKTNGASFTWQRDYYEHIIRDGEDLDRIREYILENPANWTPDENFPGNIRMDTLHRGGFTP